MNYKGVIIEESLTNTSVLKDVVIEKTIVEPVTKDHATPWLKQWTLHTVLVPEETAEAIAEKVRQALDTEHDWYADFKNDNTHYVIYRDKIFRIDRSKPEQYQAATGHGISLGIPDYQVDFSPDIKEWKR